MPTTRSQTKPILEKAKEDAKKQAAENAELAKQYWWFCGHPRARVVSIRGQQHACPDCPGARPRDGEIYFVRASLHTGD